LIWLMKDGGAVIDGPQQLDYDDYDRYTHWAPCEPPHKAAPKPVAEAVAKAIYLQWAAAPGYVDWVEGGNSDRQDKARRIARRALTPYTPSPGDSADAPVQQAGEGVPPMPETTGRRPHDDNHPEGYLESDESWSMNNPDAVSWLADNHAAIRAALKGEQPVEPSGSERGEV
jgi:hypothetical protein